MLMEGGSEASRGVGVLNLIVDLPFPVASGDPLRVAIPTGEGSPTQFDEERLLEHSG